MQIFRKKFLIYIAIIAICCFATLIYIANSLVNHATNNKLFSDINSIPARKVGLLLGTAKKLPHGKNNLYYLYRIDAASRLYKAGKIKYIIASGDNSKSNYDEPTQMKKDLIANGVPSNKIFADYAGFRTLDSVMRSKYIFQQQQITIISQAFHNQRAIFIAQKNNIDAIGFNARDVNAFYGIKTKMREKIARVKLMLDLIFGKQPKFLGKKINIP